MAFTRFNIDDIIPQFPDVHKWLIVGVRRIGKSFSVERRLVRRAIMENKPFLYVGRWAEDVQGQNVAGAFRHLIDNPSHNNIVKQCYEDMGEKYPDGAYFEVRQKSLWLCVDGADGKQIRLKRICYITAIVLAPRFKRSTYPNCTEIFFDEFVTAGAYTPRELDLFMMIVTTLAVDGVEPNIYMCGNPDNEIEFCPYLRKYGISYDDIEDNTAVIIDDDTVFVKVTRADGQGVVSKRTATAFGAVGTVATTGQIERPPVPPVPEYTRDNIYAQFSIETPVIRVDTINSVHRKKIWCDIVITDTADIYAVFTQHQSNRANVDIIHSVYDTAPRGITVMQRFNAPPHLQKITNLLFQLIREGRAYYDTPRTRNELKNLLPFQI